MEHCCRRLRSQGALLMIPLGDYQQFGAWSGLPRDWGPDGRWKAGFAGNVLEGLVTIMDEHVEAVGKGGQHGRPQPAMIGCVPWLSSGPVLDRLEKLPACCIVINKGAAASAAHRLAAANNGLPNVLPDLVDLAPAADGEPVVVGPHDEMPQRMLGPLRIAGWRVQYGRQAPLLHAKLLVLGALQWGEGEFGEEFQFFRGLSVWWGSANWTTASAQHLEV